MISQFAVRVATSDDASEAATTIARAFAGLEHLLPGDRMDEGEFLRLIQTGSEMLVATRDGHVWAAVRRWEDDGIAWLDLLASAQPGAGRALVRAVERWAQDRGLRLVRLKAPDDGRLADVFGRWGYTGYARQSVKADGGEAAMLAMERRLPLLTVREQRRADAKAIAALTGRDPWFFEQDARPDWFVASDGDTVVGTIGVRDAGAGVAELVEPALLDDYRGRGLELWMVERAALYAETHGYHTAQLVATPLFERLRRDLEDRLWHRGGGVYARRFAGRRPPNEASDASQRY